MIYSDHNINFLSHLKNKDKAIMKNTREIIAFISLFIAGLIYSQLNSVKFPKNRTHFHPWHDINPKYTAKDLVDVYIEIPKGSTTKYEIDKQYGIIRVDRVLSKGFKSPQNYGFIPKTYYLDGDPLDIYVFSSGEFVPGSIVKTRVIGILKLNDNGDGDDKVIAVCEDDKEFAEINEMSQLPIDDIVQFLKNYKVGTGKKVIVEGIEGKEKALEAIELGYKLYLDKFANI